MIFEQFFGRRKKEPQDDTLDVDPNFLERQRLEEEADQLLMENSEPEEYLLHLKECEFRYNKKYDMLKILKELLTVC